MTRVLGLIVVVLASYSLTALVCFYAQENNILDVPNERSSHSIVTPRGGGLAVAATFIFAVVFIAILDIVSINVAIALVGGGLLIAAIGWVDDKYSVSPRLRLVVHFLAAVWALYWLGGFTQMDMGVTMVHLGWAGSVLAAVGIVWLINLYNFMDGIDGIAGIEAMSVALGAGILLFWNGSQGLAWVGIILALAVGGFLIWNWPPARIFMGDVGSGFLGYVFAVLALASENSGGLPLLVWIVLLGVFVTDATVTLIRRLFKGEKLSEAHRSHVYQLAVQNGFSHKQVTLTVLGTNMVLWLGTMVMIRWTNWLLPMTVILALVLISVHIILYKRFSSRLSEGVRRGIEFQLETSQKEAAASYDDGVSECKGGEPGCSKKSPSHPRI